MAHARIGKVTPKNANVLPFKGAAVHNDRKANFVNHAGAAFDSYRAATGVEPDALVVVLGGLKQSAIASWTVQGESQGGRTTMLALAAAALNREIAS